MLGDYIGEYWVIILVNEDTRTGGQDVIWCNYTIIAIYARCLVDAIIAFWYFS